MSIFVCKYCANIFIMQEISLKYDYFLLNAVRSALWEWWRSLLREKKVELNGCVAEKILCKMLNFEKFSYLCITILINSKKMANGKYMLSEVKFSDRRLEREFLELPKRIYRGNPNWVCPFDRGCL